MKSNLYESMKEYAVQADGVEDFIRKYGKPSSYWERSGEYMEECITSHIAYLEKYGYDMITRHDSKIGEMVTYYPNNKLNEKR